MNREIYFIWDEYNIKHIKNHGVEPYEVEEAYLEDKNKKVYFDEAHSTKNEKRFIVLAVSKSTNKFLKFVFCIYGDKLRVVTAHKTTNDKKLFNLYKHK